MKSQRRLPEFIELETSRRCNRKCDWCPVGHTSDREQQDLMDIQLFKQIINNLKELGFDKEIALHNFNEPLLNPRIVEEIRFISHKLPKARTSILTNGDYLTRELVEELILAGLDWLRITLYPIPSKKRDPPSFSTIDRWLKVKKLIDLNWVYGDFIVNKTIKKGLQASINYKGLFIQVISPNIATYSSRGGTSASLQQGLRTAPCNMTSVSAAIDYRGQLKMCCNVFPESASHKRYVISQLTEISFADAWFSEEMDQLQKKHLHANWELSPICEKCHHYC